MSNRNSSKRNRPQDHKPPQDKPRTVTVQGLRLTLDPAKLDDWELMEALYDLQSDPEHNALSMVPFLRGLLGDDYPRVKNLLRDHATGRIGGEAMGEFVSRLLEELGKTAPNS